MKFFRQNLFVLLLVFAGSAVLAQTPILNSYPAATPTVFLDFDGHVWQGTAWNGSGPIVCDGSGLNTTQITAVFNRIAEDYRPFTVNITTDSTKYSAAPADKRMRLILTTSSSWYGAAGGVAYINSFTWGDNTPCFVFSALLNYNTKNIAEAGAHEIGHTLGLRHQSSYDNSCNKLSEYNGGIGSGEIGWAPIMGVGYYENLTLWNYGANPFGCTNYQDDLSIITANGNGIAYKNDDYANDLTAASPINFTNNAFTVGGIIERPADVDAVKFNLAVSSRFVLNAIPYAIGAYNAGSNIDLEIELLNSAGTIIGTYNPPTTLNASIDTTLTEGDYFLRVQGKGNIYAPNYASLGSYSLNASATPIALPVHKLQLKGTIENKQHKLEWEVIADEKIVDQTLEVSTNNKEFHAVSSLGVTKRSFTYEPNSTGILYYRLNLLFDNGKQAYSNIIALRSNGGNGKPYMIGNMITGNTISINSPSAYSYMIIDLGGRIIRKGSLLQGLNVISAKFKWQQHVYNSVQ